MSIAVISAWVAVAVAWLGGGVAVAQSPTAEALFNDGRKLLAEGKLAQACDAFEASNRVEPRAGTLIRLGECREQNHQLASAWSAYKDALTRVTNPAKRDKAKAKAKLLEPRLSYLTVSVPDDSRVDDLSLARDGKPFDPMLWNRALPVDGGDYVIAGRAPGHEEWQTTAHVPIEGGKVSVEVPKFKELIKLVAPRPPPLPVAIAAAASGPIESAAPGRLTARRKLALGVAGASVVAVVAGAVLGELASAKQRDAFRRCPDPAMSCNAAAESNALLASGHRVALAANLAFGVSAAAAIGAGILWFTGAPAAETPRRVSAIPGAAGLAIRGRF
jgi:hypothetical protein